MQRMTVKLYKQGSITPDTFRPSQTGRLFYTDKTGLAVTSIDALPRKINLPLSEDSPEPCLINRPAL